MARGNDKENDKTWLSDLRIILNRTAVDMMTKFCISVYTAYKQGYNDCTVTV